MHWNGWLKLLVQVPVIYNLATDALYAVFGVSASVFSSGTPMARTMVSDVCRSNVLTNLAFYLGTKFWIYGHAAYTHRAVIGMRDWAEIILGVKLKWWKGSQKKQRNQTATNLTNNKKLTMNIKTASFHLFLAAFFVNEICAASIRSSAHRNLALPLIAGFEPSSDVTDLVCVDLFLLTIPISSHYHAV